MEMHRKFSLGTEVGARLAEERMRDYIRASDIRRAHQMKVDASLESMMRAMERIRQKRLQNLIERSKSNGTQ
jgi:hypothetical protein